MAAILCALLGSKEISGNSLILPLVETAFNSAFKLVVPENGLSLMRNRRSVEFTPHSRESCLGAFGDSALLEGFGFGNLALSYCPSMHQLYEKFISHEIFEMPAKLLLAEHPP